MRHKGFFFSSAGDAFGHQARRSRSQPRALVAEHNVAGPSRLSSPGSAPIASPAPPQPPPPIPLRHPSLPSTSALSSPIAASTTSRPTFASVSITSSHASSSATAHDASNRPSIQYAPHGSQMHSNSLSLPFLYPPSCFEPARRTSPTVSKQHRAVRPKSSLAPTRAVSAAAAAQQLAPSHDETSHQQHLSHHFDPDFSFIRHHYDPPRHLVKHPRSHALLQQDALSQLEDEEIQEQLEADTDVAPDRTSDEANTTAAAALASLRKEALTLRQSLLQTASPEPENLVKKCRRIILQACRIQSRLHARAARAVATDTVSDCALHLLLSRQAVSASHVIRHSLVKLRWTPRTIPALEMARYSDTSSNSRKHQVGKTASSAGTPAAGLRLMLVAQQVLSELTLAPSTTSPRPTRRFESQQHFEAAMSMISAMHITMMPRSTASQTAVIRALIASGQPRLAVQAYDSEVRAWWRSHKEARRPRSFQRRQAALVAETGRPSSQALREVVRSLQQLEDLLSRVRPDLLSELPHRERQALSAKRAEYAGSLVDLIRLVRGGRLPLPASSSTPEITWILSACCRFESTVLLRESVAKASTCLDVTEKRNLQASADVIRYYLREYIKSLPDGQTRSAGTILVGGQPAIRPAIGVADYNQLIYYALSVLKSPSICKEVFQHMTQVRQPPLQPDAVTFNTILRQATTQRYEALARAVLITKHDQQSNRRATQQTSSQSSARIQHSSKSSTYTASASATANTAVDQAEVTSVVDQARPIRPMIEQIDAAIAQADSFRLVSLLQYVTASGLFLRRYRNEPGHVGTKELIMRIYPALDTRRRLRGAVSGSKGSQHLGLQQSQEQRLRPKAGQASRYAIYDPHVLTATLNLAAKAGKTGLALRVWRMIKRTSIKSASQSPAEDVSKEPWQIPVEAVTIMMQVLANEAAKAPKVKPMPRSLRLRSSVGMARLPTRASSRRLPEPKAYRQYARGWNLVASHRGWSYAKRLQTNGRTYSNFSELGEGLRWRAAQLLAKREYAFLVHHWQLSRRLATWRRERVLGWMRSETAEIPPPKRPNLEVLDSVEIMPDSRFYDAVLDVIGRRPGMVQRSRRHSTRSRVLSQLRRGYAQATEKAVTADRSKIVDGDDAVKSSNEGEREHVAQSSAITSVAPETLSASELVQLAASRVHWNSRGRVTALQPDPILVRILLDMEALGIDIPVGFRWILPYCALGVTQGRVNLQSFQNDQAGLDRKSRGAFSPFRGPRVKTVGLVARRPSSTGKQQQQP